MDYETPAMEAITDEMRQIMRAWIAEPDNTALKQRYTQLLGAYQDAFRELKRREREAGPAPSVGATHQAARGG